ncbi:hypothetical protein DFJ73DRAFT_810041 [Zopfochytrium polystomum]|nr:hypothetical protein DFJ73DRAFT_810041 [Zopfochytrium polystomum]
MSQQASDCAVVASAFPTLVSPNSACCGTWGVKCGDDGSVRIIEFYNRSLSGTLSPAISKLQSLWYIDLSGNSFSGAIPQEYTSIPLLQSLYLYRNQLTGTIPSGFSSIKSLTVLQLHQNYLTGAAPSFPNVAVTLYGNCLTNAMNQRSASECPILFQRFKARA